jgi:hypothetical protein
MVDRRDLAQLLFEVLSLPYLAAELTTRVPGTHNARNPDAACYVYYLGEGMSHEW